jgi:penicillin amidase
MSLTRRGTVAAALTLAATALVAGRPTGPLPALGPLLDPAGGIWTAARTARPTEERLELSGLGADARVEFDDRGVPHIFAASTRDAYRALGYVVARDRLFQLELQGRAGGGTLTELVGARALEADRATHASGMPHAAERRIAALDTASAGWRLLQAYVDGVNAWVATLSPADVPLEYKLLGRRPRPMRPVDVMHLFNRMGATLATTRDELVHLEASALVGREAARALFAAHAPIVEPIQPNGTETPRFEPVRLPPPGAPDAEAVALLDTLGGRDGGLARRLLAFAPERADDAIGSNNWAVAPSRSATGHALLAGDPHLELTLPSLWYEAHLVVPDTLDVYGVTIPGAPGVVIGFTRAVAWTFTNTGGDVLDYYAETVDDEAAPTRYRLDGAWRDLERQVVTYRDPAGRALATDTLRFTHRGPMRKVGRRWLSMRWTVLETSRDFEAFGAAATARTADAMLDAMASLYTAPAQNMLAIDTAGTIAIRSTGRFPRRPDDQRGDVLRDGSTSASDWTGWWGVAEYPQAFRPARGFLSSANQEPFDPRHEPRYFGADWERPWRAIRINSLLRADSAVTPDAMRRYQTDPGSARADHFVPAFITAAARAADARAARAAALLAEWDRRYTPENRRTVLFEEAMRQLGPRLWDEFRPDSGRGPVPSDMMTAVLLRDSASAWWDDRRTPAVEDRDRLLAAVLASALDSVEAKHGAPDGDGWRWDRTRQANIHHLLRIPAFSRLGLPVQGGPATLWPSTGDGRHGPSWRMVVEMGGGERKAWGLYPGGQSGNPVSARYEDRIARWVAGELDTLRLPSRAGALAAGQRGGVLVLTAAGARP